MMLIRIILLRVVPVIAGVSAGRLFASDLLGVRFGLRNRRDRRITCPPGTPRQPLEQAEAAARLLALLGASGLPRIRCI
jgi:hypothetical protein